jgi:hypothetical protein
MELLIYISSRMNHVPDRNIILLNMHTAIALPSIGDENGALPYPS